MSIASVQVANHDWRLRLRGDAVLALRNLQSDRYWKGEIEVPLRVEMREQ